MLDADVDLFTWIGGFSIRQNQQFVWSDGTAFDFKYWMPDQPANTKRDYCLIIGDLNDFIKWSSFSCQYRARFVCKKAAQ
uniref:C-type lectin domain-containing protein n=1 Tax=Steinernema glaseri TaxID=37863 RepID=A0A1I7Y0U8_9BILA